MRRPPQGATTRPVLARPGSGYGRPPGRPEPNPSARRAARDHRRWWEAATDLVGAAAVAEPAPIADGSPPGQLDFQR